MMRRIDPALLATLVVSSVGGAVHAALVWQAFIGAATVGVGLTRQSWEIERENVPYGLSLVALIMVAVPLGWFCMRLAGHSRPWRSELLALAVTIPLVGFVGTAGSFARYFARTDLTAASVLTVCIWVGVVFAGAISFYVIGRRDNRATLPKSARDGVGPQ